ncbi:MAG: hypothetical protein U0744_17655 [Gemmataceae bacterium]
MINEPQILLADEPTGNLDSATGKEILREFHRLNRELGQTIVMVTHDVVIAEQAPRVVTIIDGNIQSDITNPLFSSEPKASSFPGPHLMSAAAIH